MAFLLHVSCPINGQDIEPRKIDGAQPRNCDKHEMENRADLSYREAYCVALYHIAKDPFHNCCTIDGDNKVTLWKARVLPVQLQKVDESITFFCSEELMNLQ